ncbi:scat, partial [Symbiodinium sp. CCMP2456]
MPGEQVDASQSETWARVWDELRSQQSLASVINDPLRGSRLLRGQWEGLGEFVETVRESVGELNDQRDDGAIDPATVARIDELIGQVPEVAEFT